MTAVELLNRSHEVAQTLRSEAVLSETAIIARRNVIVRVMQTLMKDGTHYGKIPGTPKPSLFKPGAELLFSMFRIANDDGEVEDLSIHRSDGSIEEIRYRVRMVATSEIDGSFLGAAKGECSSSEEKYKWRRPVCDEEWDEAPVDRRREVWKRSDRGTAKIKQVRMSPEDIANTILRMAAKRAKVALCRDVTACSDIFTSGIEDLPAEYIETQAADKPNIAEPRRKSEAATAPPPEPEPTGPLTVTEAKWIKEGKHGDEVWNLYAITLSDGHSYSTFSQSTYRTALAAKGSGATVTIEWKPDAKKADRRNLTSIVMEAGDAE